MNFMNASRLAALAGMSLLAGAASAHTGGHAAGTGFFGGFAHPFMGLDHLLAMFGVGLWAAQQGGRARWVLPAAFLGAMALGGMLAWLGVVLPLTEGMMALSVLVLGGLVAARRRWAIAAGAALAAGFALFHGHAHVFEMPPAASPTIYASGFLLATACLHAIGVIGGSVGRRAVRVAGAGMVAAGVVLIAAG